MLHNWIWRGIMCNDVWQSCVKSERLFYTHSVLSILISNCKNWILKVIFALVCHNSFLAVRVTFSFHLKQLLVSFNLSYSMKEEELKNIPTHPRALTFSNEHPKVHRKPKWSNFMKEQVWQKLLIQPYQALLQQLTVSQLTPPAWNPSCWGKGYGNLSLYVHASPCHSLSRFQKISVTLPPACAICRITFWYSQPTLDLQTKWGFPEALSQTL